MSDQQNPDRWSDPAGHAAAGSGDHGAGRDGNEPTVRYDSVPGYAGASQTPDGWGGQPADEWSDETVASSDLPRWGEPEGAAPGYVDPGAFPTHGGYVDPAHGGQAYVDPAYGGQGYADPAYGGQGYVDPAYGGQGYADPAYGGQAYADPAAHGGHAPAGDASWAPPADGAEAAYLPPPEMYAGGGTSQYGMNLGYAVDIVFVIDITGSMTPVIEQVKAGALSFHDQLMNVMGAKDKFVSSLRLRVVAYRDYYDNASDALFHTPFFRLPDEAHHFHSYVSGLFADGGGDEPESGLEALGVAMASDWERGMDRRRHVVVLFSDASAHALETSHGRAVPGYPTHIPNTFDGLTDQWDDPQGQLMEFSAKRLLLYAPDVYPWNLISANWDNVLHYPSRAGHGLNEIEFGQIVDAIAGSV